MTNSRTTVPDDVRKRLAAAAARLDAIAVRRDAVFEELKKKYGGANADPNAWLHHIEAIGRETEKAVPDDPWPELKPEFNAIADAWLAADADLREAMSRALHAHASLQDGHLGYVRHAGMNLPAGRGVLALRRALAVAAMGGGGSDSRDTSLVLADLVRAARSKRIDADAEFARVAALASPDGSWGGSRDSPAEALRRFCSSVR